MPYFAGDLTKNPKIYVEDFIPMNHYILDKEGQIQYQKYPNGDLILNDDGNKIPIIDSKLQAYEFVWCNKAMKMLIPMNVDSRVY